MSNENVKPTRKYESMKLIIAGSRTIDFYTPFDLHEIICEHFDPYPTEIVCGMAKGPDLIGRDYALEHEIPVKEFPADWETYGKRAGFIRNDEMAQYADVLLAIWDGKSNGTRHMIRAMLELHKPFHVELNLWPS